MAVRNKIYIMNKHYLTRSIIIGSIIAIVFIVIITIVGELYKIPGADGKMVSPIKDLLKSLHGHHWVGKGIWAVGLFSVTTIATFLVNYRNQDQRSLNPLIALLTATLLIGTITLLGFNIYEYLV